MDYGSHIVVIGNMASFLLAAAANHTNDLQVSVLGTGKRDVPVVLRASEGHSA